MRGCAGRRRVVSRSPMTPHASSMSTRARSRVCSRSSSMAKRDGSARTSRTAPWPFQVCRAKGSAAASRCGQVTLSTPSPLTPTASRPAPSSRTGMTTAADTVQGPTDRLELPLVEEAAEQRGQVVEPVLTRHPAFRRVARDLVGEECRHEVVARDPLPGSLPGPVPGTGAHVEVPGKGATGIPQSTARDCTRPLHRAVSSSAGPSGSRRRHRRRRRRPCRAGASRGAAPLPASVTGKGSAQPPGVDVAAPATARSRRRRASSVAMARVRRCADRLGGGDLEAVDEWRGLLDDPRAGGAGLRRRVDGRSEELQRRRAATTTPTARGRACPVSLRRALANGRARCWRALRRGRRPSGPQPLRARRRWSRSTWRSACGSGWLGRRGWRPASLALGAVAALISAVGTPALVSRPVSTAIWRRCTATVSRTRRRASPRGSSVPGGPHERAEVLDDGEEEALVGSRLAGRHGRWGLGQVEAQPAAGDGAMSAAGSCRRARAGVGTGDRAARPPGTRASGCRRSCGASSHARRPTSPPDEPGRRRRGRRVSRTTDRVVPRGLSLLPVRPAVRWRRGRTFEKSREASTHEHGPGPQSDARAGAGGAGARRRGHLRDPRRQASPRPRPRRHRHQWARRRRHGDRRAPALARRRRRGDPSGEATRSTRATSWAQPPTCSRCPRPGSADG